MKMLGHFSPLLRLPAELLQEIYWYCLEPSLLICTNHLASLLSKEDIYDATILHAFYNPSLVYWSSEKGVIGKGASAFPKPFRHAFLREPKSLARAKERKSNARLRKEHSLLQAERARRQTCVLQSRWCTYNRLATNMARLRLALFQDSRYAQRLDFPDSELQNINRWLLTTSPSENVKGLKVKNRNGNTIYFRSYGRNKEMISFSTDPNLWWKHSYECIEPFEFLTIPSSILDSSTHSPSQLELFCTLTTASDPKRYVGASRPKLQHNPAALHAGMLSAIKARNPQALLILCYIAYKAPAPHERLPGSLFQALATQYSFFRGNKQERQVQVHISTSMFMLLLRYDQQSMPSNSDVLHDWAIHLRARPEMGAHNLGKWIMLWNRPWAAMAEFTGPLARAWGQDHGQGFAKEVSRLQIGPA